ncbi:MAG: hypothetical protein Tsb0016_23250 [Sphingomonadales bacterium]
MLRSDIKKAHERACVESFIDWHRNRYGSHYIVEAYPDPPDALLCCKTKRSWVEVADVYWTSAWAKDQNTFVAENEIHEPIKDTIYEDMDKIFSGRFCEVLEKKIQNKEYMKVSSERGMGFLILNMMSPFFDDDTWRCMRLAWDAEDRPDNRIFQRVYCRFRSKNSFAFRRFPIEKISNAINEMGEECGSPPSRG